MTLSNRNLLIKLCIISSFIIFLISIVSITVFLIFNNEGSYNEDAIRSLILKTFTFCLFPVFSMISSFLLLHYFRKTTSVEFFFFIMFLFSISLDGLKNIYLILQISNINYYFNIMITRIIFMGKFFGILCLFASGLFTTGLKYQKHSITMGFIILISFTLSISIPMNSNYLSNFMNIPGFKTEIDIIFLIIEALCVINYLLAGYLKNDFQYFFIAAGVIVLVAGRELSFYNAGLISSIVSLVLLSAGTVVIGRKLHELYLWS